MQKNNVWIISQYTSPEDFGYYTKYHSIVKKLSNNHNYKMRIVSSSSSGHHNFNIKNTKTYKNFNFDNVDYLLLKNNFINNKKINKILGTLEFSIRLIFNINLALKEKPKILLVSVPNSIITIPSIFLAKIIGAKIIIEVRDIWPLAQKELYGIGVAHPFYLFYKAIEFFSHRFSDYIISPITNYETYLKEYKIRYNNFEFIRQSVNMIDNPIKEKNNKPIVGLYSGNMNSFRPILEFLKGVKLCDDLECKFVFIGEGEKLNIAKEYVSKNNISNVHFIGRKNKKETLKYMNKVNFGISLLYKSDLYNKYGLCALKLYQYMSYNIPIFSIGNNASCSDMDDKIGSSFCLSTQPDHIAKHLKYFINNFNNHQHKALNSRYFLRKNCSDDVIASKLDKLFLTLIK
tara:strand:+ start:4984 stop:6192 length:1209 start_codon:yes stop_codon:yes gene_type:complete